MADNRSPADPVADGDEPPRPVSTLDADDPVTDPLTASEDPPAVHYDDEERPARNLTGRVGLVVSAVAFAVALLVLWQVFRPLAQGSQYYLIIFLAGTLPLVFLCYQPGFGRRTNTPAALDWVRAAVTLVVCLYPVNPFGGGYDAFLDRQGLLEPV